MKILVAEDYPAIRTLNQKLLTNWGYHVDLAVNGKEAVECVHKSEKKGAVNYDLCLMDVNMPIMNGIEAIQIIRQNTTYLPIIACSTNPDNKMPCLEAGADKFLLKPHPSAELKKMLEEFTVKQNIFYLDGENRTMRKVGPGNSAELTELRMLNKKGITKFTLVDTSFRFLAYKNMQNKLLDDFNDDNFRLTKTLDDKSQKHDSTQTYTSQVWQKKMDLTPKQFWERVEQENEILKKYFSL